MRPRVLLVALAAVCLVPLAHAQIALTTLVGTTQTPVTSYYNYPSIAPNATLDVTFVATNTSTTNVFITKLALSGIGFAIVNTSTMPPGGFLLTPGQAFDFFVRFTGGPVGNYQANLQVNSTIIGLEGSVVQAGTLTVAAPCTGPDASGNISFGRLPQTQQVTCNFTVTNPYTQALTVSPITLTGAAFNTTQSISANIPAGQSISFPVIFTATTASVYSGSLIVGVQTYFLTGTGYLSPLPAPTLSFGATSLLSATQYNLSGTLPSPAQAAVTGTITMSFTSAVSGVTDDTAIMFVAASTRSAGFRIAQGSTVLIFDANQSVVMGFTSQQEAIFSTGTTAGTITFTVDVGAIGISGNATTTATIAPAPIAVTQANAANLTADLTVGITGYDNTYSMGAMTFTFFDTSGKQLGSPIQANFSPQFQSFYQNQDRAGVSPGSAFAMLATFPLTGNGALVGSVSIQLTNTAGITTVTGVNFP
jgi:hypothetical protein